MKDYGSYSFWLETSGDDLTPRPRLDGSIDVDIAVMGAGYTGLWTAYYLLLREPSLRVAVVEREIAGFGASGRAAPAGSCAAPGTANAARASRSGAMDRNRIVIERWCRSSKLNVVDGMTRKISSKRPPESTRRISISRAPAPDRPRRG